MEGECSQQKKTTLNQASDYKTSVLMEIPKICYRKKCPRELVQAQFCSFSSPKKMTVPLTYSREFGKTQCLSNI